MSHGEISAGAMKKVKSTQQIGEVVTIHGGSLYSNEKHALCGGRRVLMLLLVSPAGEDEQPCEGAEATGG